MPLLEPVPPIRFQRPLGVRWIEEDEPIAPSELHREPVQEAQHLGRRLQGKARDPDDPEMVLADAGLESPGEILAREDTVQVHGNLRDQGTSARQNAYPFGRLAVNTRFQKNRA